MAKRFLNYLLGNHLPINSGAAPGHEDDESDKTKKDASGACYETESLSPYSPNDSPLSKEARLKFREPQWPSFLQDILDRPPSKFNNIMRDGRLKTACEIAFLEWKVEGSRQEWEERVRSERQPSDWKRGYDEGKEWGLSEGKRLGLTEGKELGLSEGKRLGLSKGKELGLSEGKRLGLTEGKELALSEEKLGLNPTSQWIDGFRAGVASDKKPVLQFIVGQRRSIRGENLGRPGRAGWPA